MTYAEEYRENNRDKLRAYQTKRRRQLKFDALAKYGEVCQSCGFSDWRALQIDHIDNNGAEERKSLGGQKFSGRVFYEWLKKQNYPKGYQTLCANCNVIKQFEFITRVSVMGA